METRVSPFECYYGQSGTGKSESAAAVIENIYQHTGKKARVIVGDGSGATYESLVSAGIVDIADYSIRDWPLSTLTQFCDGFWPEDPLDPKSKMKPMDAATFSRVGIYVIEGLSVGATYVMGDKKGGFAERAGRGEKIAGESPIQLIDLERDERTGQPKPNTGPGYIFGGVTLGGYGQAQRRMLGFVEKSKALPGWVIWTAHERASEDKISNQKLIGPEVAGGALTANLSRYFNNTLHFATAEKTKKEKDDHTEKMVDHIDAEFRIYFLDHFRPEGNTFVKYKAVNRHPDPKGLKLGDAFGLPKEGYLESAIPGKSIIDFYQNIKAAREKTRERLVAITPPA